MPRLNALTALAALALASTASAATLNKCIDAEGNVTYSNLPCRNAQKARTLKIDPAPLPEPARAASSPPPASSSEPATIQLETRRTGGRPAVSRASSHRCDTLTEKLGNTVDKMDQARRKGYTQPQMNKWNQEVKDLERQKQQSGCF